MPPRRRQRAPEAGSASTTRFSSFTEDLVVRIFSHLSVEDRCVTMSQGHGSHAVCALALHRLTRPPTGGAPARQRQLASLSRPRYNPLAATAMQVLRSTGVPPVAATG
jgi:hypothetical protein